MIQNENDFFLIFTSAEGPIKFGILQRKIMQFFLIFTSTESPTKSSICQKKGFFLSLPLQKVQRNFEACKQKKRCLSNLYISKRPNKTFNLPRKMLFFAPLLPRKVPEKRSVEGFLLFPLVQKWFR